MQAQQLIYGRTGQVYSNQPRFGHGPQIYNPSTAQVSGPRPSGGQYVVSDQKQLYGHFKGSGYTPQKNQRGFVRSVDNYGYGYPQPIFQDDNVPNKGSIGNVEPFQSNQQPSKVINDPRYFVSSGVMSLNPSNSGVGLQRSPVAAVGLGATGSRVNRSVGESGYEKVGVHLQKNQTRNLNTKQSQYQTIPSPRYNFVDSYLSPSQGNKYVEKELQRPKYPKLYNNRDEYYRSSASQQDPIPNKTACLPICWVLCVLVGLLLLSFGILCGIGVFCPHQFLLPPRKNITLNTTGPTITNTITNPNQPPITQSGPITTPILPNTTSIVSTQTPFVPKLPSITPTLPTMTEPTLPTMTPIKASVQPIGPMITSGNKGYLTTTTSLRTEQPTVYTANQVITSPTLPANTVLTRTPGDDGSYGYGLTSTTSDLSSASFASMQPDIISPMIAVP